MLEKTVLEWVARDAVGYGYLLDFYRRGARVCWADEAGLALKDDAHDIVYTGGTVPPHVPELGDSMLLLTDSRPLAQELTARGHYRDIMTCAQALYLKKEPVVLTAPAGHFRAAADHGGPGLCGAELPQPRCLCLPHPGPHCRGDAGRPGGRRAGRLCPACIRRGPWDFWRCCRLSAAGAWRKCWRPPSSTGSCAGGVCPTAMCG